MYSEVITLLSKTETVNPYGDIVASNTERDVFGRLDRIYFTETLQAMAQGFERQARFRLADYYEYHGEEELIFEGKTWQIKNVQRIGTEIELNCVGGIEHGKS